MDWILERFKTFNDRLAIIYKNQSYSYQQLYDYVLNIKEILKSKSISEGEVVALLSDYNYTSIALFLSLFINKNIIVPITTNIKDELDVRLNESFATTITTIEENEILFKKVDNKELPHQHIITLQKSQSPGLVLFSSGSSGTPKAMIHDLNAIFDSHRNRKPRNTVFLLFLLFDHVGGINSLLSCLISGYTIVIPSERDPEDICRLIEYHKVNILPVSPTFLNLILLSEVYKNYDMSSLRLITYGTEPMQENILIRLKETFPRVKFLQTFGTSETGIIKGISKSSVSTFIKFDDPNQEYKIVDGELWLRSRTQILGYLNHSMEKFTVDGWFKTGDLVEETDDGFVKIIGRQSDVINVGGEKLLPAEVENVLWQIPFVIDCLVYGENNVITGQSVCADIVLKKGQDVKQAKKDLRAYCNQNLESFKIPTRIKFLDTVNFSSRYKKIRRR